MGICCAGIHGVLVPYQIEESKMSACNIVVTPKIAYLFADGASYDSDGRVTAINGKMRLMSSISAVMISTGRVADSIYIASRLEGRAESFDHLIDNISEWLPVIV